MKTWKLNAMVTVSAFTKVEAETREEAIEIAKNRPVYLDRQGMTEDEVWIIEEADGEPREIDCDE